MPEYTDCVKIHEGCGGIVRWVEAINTPGVGWHGECLHCGAECLPIESLLPVRGLDMETARNASTRELRGLEWDDDDTWRHNQKRLAKEVESL